MNSRAIHETVVRDVVDILTDIKDYDEVQFLLNRKSTTSFRSAASATKDMILTFPVICSSDISIENASMIAKAVERKAVAMMQMLFSAISISSSDNAIDYLKKIHTNVDFGSNDISITNIVDTIEKTANALEAMDMAEIDHEVFDEIAQQLRDSNYYLPDSISEHSIGDYAQYQNGMVVCHEADDDRYSRQASYDYDELKTRFDNLSRASSNLAVANAGLQQDLNDLQADYAAQTSRDRRAINRLVDANRNLRNRQGTNVNVNVNGGRGGHNGDSYKDTYEMFNKQILPSEIKKANELMPTLMVVTFNQKVKDIDTPVVSHVVIGIKAKLYPIDSREIINKIQSKVADNNWLNKFIRATTNEISFVKDFMFAIDKAKLDAMSYSSKSKTSKIWRILERRSKKSKIRQAMKMSNDASAVSTLLVSQDVVEYLKKNENINLENPKTAYAIMGSYNFMSIAICDESLETAKFIYDTGDDMYETISFSHLEREASDGAYKKVINLMTKMQR